MANETSKVSADDICSMINLMTDTIGYRPYTLKGEIFYTARNHYVLRPKPLQDQKECRMLELLSRLCELGLAERYDKEREDGFLEYRLTDDGIQMIARILQIEIRVYQPDRGYGVSFRRFGKKEISGTDDNRMSEQEAAETIGYFIKSSAIRV